MNSAPGLLLDLDCEGLLTREHLIALVGDVWALAEFPMRQLDRDEWLRLFGGRRIHPHRPRE